MLTEQYSDPIDAYPPLRSAAPGGESPDDRGANVDG